MSNTISKIKVNDVVYDIKDSNVENKIDSSIFNETIDSLNNTINNHTTNENIHISTEDINTQIQNNLLGLSITYDSNTKEIKLMSGTEQIGDAIDATDFIKDGMVSNAELVAGEGDDEGKMFIEITFNSDAESDPIRIDVSSLVDAGIIAELKAILKGYGTEEGETVSVKSDIDNLQGQINAIHTHDNKAVLDTITEAKVKAWDDADRKIYALNGSRPLLLDDRFNINDYTKQGIYYFKGERINANDNLPIINAAPGHSISVQLTVLDASLSDAEMCVSQYLKLTNRTGSEGKEYIRTYNKYLDGNEGWSVWREIKQTTNLNQISDDELKIYTENGLYEGAIYNGYDTENPPSVFAKFLADISTADGAKAIPSGSLFSMQVLNNYAVVQKAEQMGLRMPQSIVQIAKVLLINSQFVEVVRTYIGESNNWSNWKISSVIIGS